MRTGSSPESGSSNITIAGSSTRARANPARLRMPPESSFGIFCVASASPTSRRRRLQISEISSSDLSVCWRSGKAVLSNTFIEPNRAPSWNRRPNFLRISNSSSSVRFGTDSPWTSTSPASGYRRPTMCLISTLFGPGGPSTIEIWSLGSPRLRPFRIRVRPNCLTRSMISIASSPPWSRFSPVCQRYGLVLGGAPRPGSRSPVQGAELGCGLPVLGVIRVRLARLARLPIGRGWLPIARSRVGVRLSRLPIRFPLAAVAL